MKNEEFEGRRRGRRGRTGIRGGRGGGGGGGGGMNMGLRRRIIKIIAVH